jgi:hypothetical protein
MNFSGVSKNKVFVICLYIKHKLKIQKNMGKH